MISRIPITLMSPSRKVPLSQQLTLQGSFPLLPPATLTPRSRSAFLVLDLQPQARPVSPLLAKQPAKGTSPQPGDCLWEGENYASRRPSLSLQRRLNTVAPSSPRTSGTGQPGGSGGREWSAVPHTCFHQTPHHAFALNNLYPSYLHFKLSGH